jgi:hypothetical protein
MYEPCFVKSKPQAAATSEPLVVFAGFVDERGSTPPAIAARFFF